MDFLTEPLGHAFLRRALFAGVAIAAAAGLLGPFVVQRGLAFLADGLAHATFGGIALGLLLGAGLDPPPSSRCPSRCSWPSPSAGYGVARVSAPTWRQGCSSRCLLPWA